MVQLISPQQKQLSAYSYGWTDLGTVSVQYNMVNMAIFFFFSTHNRPWLGHEEELWTVCCEL